MIRLPDPCLVVLVGASSCGKSHWAAQWFHPDAIVSSDRLRAVVGRGEHDQRASKDAFEVLDLVVDKRLRRGLVTVVDSTALEADRRRAYLSLAARHGVPVYAVLFEPDEQLLPRSQPDACRARAAEGSGVATARDRGVAADDR